ncbi:MAG: Obg family GTPase CgtA [Patescibacteria group bacterium]
MLIDDLIIKVRSGNGGNGIVAWSRNKMSLGPTGGAGGNGGNIYFEGISDLAALNSLRRRKLFEAEDGFNGRRQLNDGTRGADLVIKVPVGTVIHNLTTKSRQEVVKIGERVLAAQGGLGGQGNYHFRGPKNTSPRRYQLGLPGEEFDLRLELKLIADVGLIGLPNAGKSSLLNALTKAKSKVANYEFTTLEPHLGVHYGLTLADIPGLIEGASEGKGLGVKFLRHIERTRVLAHLISAESATPAEDYKLIRRELGAYNEELLDKEEFLLLTKSDAVEPDLLQKRLAKLKKLNPNTLAISIYDDASLGELKKILNKITESKTVAS